MTDDRDFKDLVRKRAAKTGESYQAARRQLEAQRQRFSARVDALFRTPEGIAFGCTIEEGGVARGMTVTVAGDGIEHRGTVTSLRRWKWDVDSVALDDAPYAQFGMIVDPPYDGPIPARV
ncbi:MAG TPA: hypothetical protein VEA78_01545, partial [Acidimicrobiales bacterium]|nr:hypothetical protein [Acidimicrobiales bacterium]